MAIDTYAKLQSAISDELNRNDLLAAVTTYSSGTIDGAVKRSIENCEYRIQRTLRIRQMETSTSITTVGGTSSYALPSDFLSARLAYISADPVVVLQQTTLENLFSQYPSAATSQPAQIAVAGANLLMRPVPDSAYTIPFFYYAKPAPLTDTNSTNTILAVAPDLYLYGSCLEATRFLGEDARIQVWKGFYDEAVRLITEDSNAAKWSGVLVQAALPVTVVV